MRLVRNWKTFWRWTSVQVFAIMMVLPIVWDSLPYDLKDTVPYHWRPYIFTVLAVIGIIGRLRDQGTQE